MGCSCMGAWSWGRGQNGGRQDGLGQEPGALGLTRGVGSTATLCVRQGVGILVCSGLGQYPRGWPAGVVGM